MTTRRRLLLALPTVAVVVGVLLLWPRPAITQDLKNDKAVLTAAAQKSANPINALIRFSAKSRRVSYRQTPPTVQT